MIGTAVLSFDGARWWSTVPAGGRLTSLDVTAHLARVYAVHEGRVYYAPCAHAEVQRVVERLISGPA